MKIINKTKWTTAHLAAIARRIGKAELSPEVYKQLCVEFVTGGRRGSSGLAWTRRIRIRVPAAKYGPLDAFCRVDLCSVIAHEMKHVQDGADRVCRGGRSWEIHKRRSIPYGRPHTTEGRNARNELYAWSNPLPIEPKPLRAKRPKPSRETIVEKKRLAAAAMLKKWQTKAKLAATKCKQYRNKVRRYEKQLTVAASPPAS